MLGGFLEKLQAMTSDGTIPHHSEEFTKNVMDIASLKDGWFEGSGVAPTREVIEMVERVVGMLKQTYGVSEEPVIVAIPEGGVDLVWKRVALYCTFDLDLTFVYREVTEVSGTDRISLQREEINLADQQNLQKNLQYVCTKICSQLLSSDK